MPVAGSATLVIPSGPGLAHPDFRGQRRDSLLVVAVAGRVGGDLDPLEAAGGDVVVELDAGVAAEVAGDQLGDRLADDQADGLVAVAADQGPEGAP